MRVAQVGPARRQGGVGGSAQTVPRRQQPPSSKRTALERAYDNLGYEKANRLRTMYQSLGTTWGGAEHAQGEGIVLTLIQENALPTKKVKSLALKYIAIPHEFKAYYPTPTKEDQCGSTTSGVDPTHTAADETTTTPDSNTGEPDQVLSATQVNERQRLVFPSQQKTRLADRRVPVWCPHHHRS
jgi:hypothetical protein